MGKVNKVISYQNLSPAELELFNQKYPNGYNDYVIKVTTPKSEFWGVTLDTPDASYLVKVTVKIDTNPEEFDEKDYGEESTSSEGGDSFGDGAEDFDTIADEAEE